jgi:membrane associated rhomboid family serine protease
VSPYITECPYCGNRLRKRAPKLDRNGRFGERLSRRPPAPSLPRLRRGEIPGIRHDTHAYATIALVVLGIVGCLVWRTSAIGIYQLDVVGNVGSQWWRVFSAPSVYDNAGYAFVVLGAIALYGTLLERRHGPLLVIALVLLGGVGGTALSAQLTYAVVTGGNGAALALLVAWAMEDLLSASAGREIDGDLIGTAVFAVVIALMPLAVIDASWIADGVGVVAGALLGYPLARMHPSAA